MTAIDPMRLFEPPPREQLTLADRFLVPPFSVLDARAGYWQERKQQWLGLGIRGEVGRNSPVFGTAATAGEGPMIDQTFGIQSGAGRKSNLLGMSKTVLAAQAGQNPRKDEERARLEAEIAATRGLDSGAGRDAALLTDGREGYGQRDTAKGESAWGGAGTSIFDPVLCELAYRWFSPLGGAILDPFAGGSVRGIVAAALERAYLGIDLRPEQCAANEAQAEALGAQLEWPCPPAWLVGDSRGLPALCGGARFDFVFSCPPYYDLEQYSDDPADLSNADTYAEFRCAYDEIIWHAVEALKDDRFACFVVGDVRGKDGHYLGLVPDTIRAFAAAGARFYNEGILVTSVGSLPIRTSRIFGAGRKLGKTHQNILVFCKGDPKRAAQACGELGAVALDYGGAYHEAPPLPLPALEPLPDEEP